MAKERKHLKIEGELKKWELPMTISALSAVMGYTNYFSAYIMGCAEIAAPF